MTVESPLTIKSELLIFAASDGTIYFYDKNTAVLKEKIQLGAPALTAPIIKRYQRNSGGFLCMCQKI